MSVLRTLRWRCDFPSCQPQPSRRSTCMHCGAPTSVAVRSRRRPIREPRSDAAVAIRNGSQRSQTGTIRSFLTCLSAAKQSRVVLILARQHVALATVAFPRPPRAGSCPGSICARDASLETSALGRVPGMPRKRPSTDVAIAHSSARIREPESALRIPTAEARLE
jgi:hypothetical protein